MKSVILSMLLVGSFANAALICKNENSQANNQTLFVFDGNNLGAICQRSLVVNGTKKSNEEICANDMFVLSGSSSGSGKVTNVYQSTTTGVGLAVELSNKIGTVELNSNYQAATIKGGNRVLIAKGKIKITCN